MDVIEFEDHVFLTIHKMKKELEQEILLGLPAELYLSYMDRIKVLNDVEDKIREKM